MKTRKNKTKKKNLEEIEIIDIDYEEENQVSKKIQKRKKLKKGLLAQTIFCAVSIIFIFGCCVFYGGRLIKYYKIYNPKDDQGNAIQLLGSYITSHSSLVYEGEGLYASGGTYVYKGTDVNNYLKYSNLLWRIVKINSDGTVDIVLDQSVNNLKWNKEITDYTSSDINQYLNQVFLPLLNRDIITNTTVCNDLIDEVSKISCTKSDSSQFVRLLTIDEFLNSKIDPGSFISDGDNIWLSSRGTTSVWTINDANVSYAAPDNAYHVKPVVTLKNSNQVMSGDGSLEKPYMVEKETSDVQIGDHIQLGEDVWTVYQVEKDQFGLSLSSLYQGGTKTYRFDLTSNQYDPTASSSLAKYLNEDFYQQLSYQESIVDHEWYTGVYDESYEDIYQDKVVAKVGISSVVDLKLDDATNYYLSNGIDTDKIYLFGETLIESKPTLSRAIKPSIFIQKKAIKSGEGTVESPYVLEE